MADLDPDALFTRIEQLARAQCDVDQIRASLRVEYLIDAGQLRAFFESPEVLEWIDVCAVAGQGELQARMWQVADQLCDTPVGSKMAQWLARNFLNHSGSDVSTEIKALLSQLKADPTGQVQLLDRALALVQGGRA